MRNIVLSLPESIRKELELRHRRDGANASTLSAWLATQSIQVGYQPLNRFLKSLDSKIDKAESIAELTLATTNIQAATGIDLGLDFIDRLDLLYGEGLKMVTAEIFAEMRPIDILNSANRYAAVKIQAEKFRQEMRDRIAAELKAIRLEPDINEDTLDKIEQRIYGIY